MSFKEFDKKTFIADTARDFAARRISKRDFLRKTGMAGLGFSAFATGLLGNQRPFRGNLVGDAAYAQTPEEMMKWLKDVSGPFKGSKVRYTSEATPPTVVLNQIKGEFTDATGIEVEIEIVPLEQVLAKAIQDVQGQLGTYDIYYLDQSWVATFSPDTVDPVQYYKDKPDLAMPGFDWDDFSKPLVEGLALYQDKWGGIPFDIPIFITMYRKDILEKHGIKPPTTVEEFTAGVKAITEAEKANGMFGTGLQAKSGHYSLECDWTQAIWNQGGSIFGADKKFKGNDEAAVAGLQWYQEMLKNAPAQSTASTWDGQFQMMQAGQVGLVNSWDEFFPGLDADDSKVKGLWEPLRPITGKPLRPVAEAGFGEIPNNGHQGGSIFGADKKFKGNDEAAVAGLQWYQEMLKNAPAQSTASTWDGQFQMMQAGQVALVNSWDEFFPGLDADDSKVKGLWEPLRPITGKPLRPVAEAGFGEIPNNGHQGGSILGLSKYSKNLDAAWLFMQWACSKEIMTRCTLLGGFAPMRLSSFDDPRVKAKAVVGPGTTRHLETVKWTIDNAMASEPDMPLWAGFSNNEIPVELGKLLTGQDYGGDAKKCMDNVAAMIDKAVADSGL